MHIQVLEYSTDTCIFNGITIVGVNGYSTLYYLNSRVALRSSLVLILKFCTFLCVVLHHNINIIDLTVKKSHRF